MIPILRPFDQETDALNLWHLKASSCIVLAMISCILLTIGDELLDGRVLNKHQQSISQALFPLGYEVIKCISLRDDKKEIINSIRKYMKECSVLISTGGLGPTSDDCTREAAAEALESPLIWDRNSFKHIQEIFNKLQRPMATINNRQAYFPKNAIILKNPLGTAPGFYIKKEACHLFFLPGVPFEMIHMLKEEVQAHLFKHFGPVATQANKVYKCFGIGESSLGEIIESMPKPNKNCQILYRAHFPELHISLRYPKIKEPLQWVHDVEKALEQWCFSKSSTEDYIDYFIKTLLEKDQKLILVESCTGGLLSQLITQKKGATAYFLGALITYSNSLKEDLCGVSKESLKKEGAVSNSVALEMAKGALEKHPTASISIAITGIAGPSGATESKKVGTVFIAVANSQNSIVKQQLFSGSRSRIQTLSAYTAMQLCIAFLKENN